MNNEERLLSEKVRHRIDVFKSWLVDGADFVGKYEIPRIEHTTAVPLSAIPFDKAIDKTDSTTKYDQWVHFYQEDERFERFWNNPKSYLERLKRFQGVISPDFSLYRDLPLSMQIFNVYRNHALAVWLQRNGVKVVSNAVWGDSRSYEFCFDGTPRHSTVATSTNGCLQDKLVRKLYIQGLSEMVKRLKPETIVVYSYMPSDIFEKYRSAGIRLVHIPNYNDTVRGRA